MNQRDHLESNEAFHQNREVDGQPSQGQRLGIQFSPIRLDKFVILCITTFGLYEMVWFYRNWKRVEHYERSKLIPWARALFAPFWYYALLNRISHRFDFALVVLYFALHGMVRLPDPYWMLSLLSFLALLPPVLEINARTPVEQRPKSWGWRKRDLAVAGAGGAFLFLIVLGEAGPPSSVLPREDLPRSYEKTLLEAGILDPRETLLYFYSPAFFSVESEGVFVSDWGVTFYYTEPSAERNPQVIFLEYDHIESIEVKASENWYEDTLIRLTDSSGGWARFPLSSENGMDEVFIEEIEKRSSVRRTLVSEGSGVMHAGWEVTQYNDPAEGIRTTVLKAESTGRDRAELSLVCVDGDTRVEIQWAEQLGVDDIPMATLLGGEETVGTDWVYDAGGRKHVHRGDGAAFVRGLVALEEEVLFASTRLSRTAFSLLGLGEALERLQTDCGW